MIYSSIISGGKTARIIVIATPTNYSGVRGGISGHGSILRKLPCEEFQRTSVPGDADVARYVKEWDSAEYTKAVPYRQVATALIGCLYEFYFHLPFGD